MSYQPVNPEVLLADACHEAVDTVVSSSRVHRNPVTGLTAIAIDLAGRCSVWRLAGSGASSRSLYAVAKVFRWVAAQTESLAREVEAEERAASTMEVVS